MTDLYELNDIISNNLVNKETIEPEIVKSLSKLVIGNGYIGIAQINPAAGNIEYNAKKIAEYIKISNRLGLEAVIFPRLSLLGCPMENIAKRHPVIFNDIIKWLKGLAKITENTIVVIGCLSQCDDGNYCNASAILQNGVIQNITSTVMQEYKNYAITTNGNFDDIIKYLKNNKKAKLLINCSEITYKQNKDILNSKLLSNLSSNYSIPIIHVNQTGVNDNILYEGISSVYNSKGKLIARAKAYEEQFLIVNPDKNVGKIYSLPVGYENAIKEQQEFSLDYENDMERTYKALINGIKDYFSKCGLKRAVLGLSGGLDSTVCAVLLADALGKENVIGVSMPSHITSQESKTDAALLADNLGINYFEAPIRSMIDVTTECFNELFYKIESKWNDRYTKSYTPDNIQARSRAMILYGISNEFPNCIPIATSDKSEAYMGYATINGDMSGGYAPIADITKTKLFALAAWLNKNRDKKNCIPESIIKKRPGAELAINPKTGKPLIAEDALMPYEFLDEIIWRIENRHESYKDMINKEFLYEKKNNVTKSQKQEWLDKFYKRMSSALFKWSIMPPSAITEPHSINGAVYHQPITSGYINYKGTGEDYINESLDLS